MSFSLNPIYCSFKKDIEDLNRIINDISTGPSSVNRDTHIEGCFIRFVALWEVFCEEYFLRCLCAGISRSGYKIKPLAASPRNRNEAFKKININRRQREKDYLDWLDSSILQQRVNDYFRSNSRVQKLAEAPDRLYEIRTIRNAIAHKSTMAISKFEKYVKDQLGYLSSLNPSVSELLVMKKRRSREPIFFLISKYYLNLANRLTK